MCISFYEPSRKRLITLTGTQGTLELRAHNMEPASCHLLGRLKCGNGAYRLENRRSSLQVPSNDGIRTCMRTHARTLTLSLSLSLSLPHAFSNPFTVSFLSPATHVSGCPHPLQTDASAILLVVNHPGTLRQWKSDARAFIGCHKETYTSHLIK